MHPYYLQARASIPATSHYMGRDLPSQTGSCARPCGEYSTLPPSASKQRSLLLDLPHNVRHFIYAELLSLEPAVAVHIGIAAPHHLTQTCRLLRSEFVPRRQRQVTITATEFNFEITDFDFNDAKAFIQRLSLLKPSDRPRKLFIHLRLSTATAAGWTKATTEAMEDRIAWLESRNGRLRARRRDCSLWYGFHLEMSKQYVNALTQMLSQETAEYARTRPMAMRQHQKRIEEALMKAYMFGDEFVEDEYGRRRKMTAIERDLRDRILSDGCGDARLPIVRAMKRGSASYSLQELVCVQ